MPCEAGLPSIILGGSPSPAGEGHSCCKLLTGVRRTQTGMEGAGRGWTAISQIPKNFSPVPGMTEPNVTCRLVHGRWVHGVAMQLDLYTASSILLHLFAIPDENCFKKTEIQQTHLEFVILKARKNLKKENQTRNHRKILQIYERPLNVLITEATQRHCQIFFPACWKNSTPDRSALSSVRRIGLALLKLRVELGMRAGSWSNSGFHLNYGETSTSHRNLGSTTNI